MEKTPIVRNNKETPKHPSDGRKNVLGKSLIETGVLIKPGEQSSDDPDGMTYEEREAAMVRNLMIYEKEDIIKAKNSATNKAKEALKRKVEQEQNNGDQPT